MGTKGVGQTSRTLNNGIVQDFLSLVCVSTLTDFLSCADLRKSDLAQVSHINEPYMEGNVLVVSRHPAIVLRDVII
jgi:hypothetical protein